MDNLIEKYLGEVKQDPRDFSDDDWIVYDEHTGHIAKFVKKGKNKMNISRHFSSSKHAGAKIGYAKKHLVYIKWDK